MKLAVITLMPEMVETGLGFGITGRALDSGCLSCTPSTPRCHTQDAHRTVDDKPYGGGPGMVMKVQPLRRAIRQARQLLPQARVIYTTPAGRRLDQSGVHELAGRRQLILLAGRYEGIDERVIEQDVDEEWSIGDFVISGGELATMVMIDALCRLLPGALGDARSAREDSFVDGCWNTRNILAPKLLTVRQFRGSAFRQPRRHPPMASADGATTHAHAATGFKQRARSFAALQKRRITGEHT